MKMTMIAKTAKIHPVAKNIVAGKNLPYGPETRQHNRPQIGIQSQISKLPGYQSTITLP